MARLYMGGAEIDGGDISIANAIGAGPDGGVKSGGSRDTVTFRSGLASWKCDSGAGNTTQTVTFPALTVVDGNSYFARAYFNAASAPTATITILELQSGGAGVFGVQMNTNGTLNLLVSSATQGSASASIADGTWHRVELKGVASATTVWSAAELLVDGVSVATFSGSSARGGVGFVVGWLTAPGANKVINIDDVALNDSTGAANTGYPGSGRVVLLSPTADSAVGTGWTNSAGTGTSLFDCVNNTPPTGIADTTANAGHQIRNATSNANVNYDATMTTYTAAGVGASDTVNAVIPWCATAAPVTTGAKQGTMGVASNPTIANVSHDATGTSGAFWAGSTAGTYGSGWKWTKGTMTNAPSVTKGTAPVMRVTQVTSSTRIAMCCAMFIYVDYTPSGTLFTHSETGGLSFVGDCAKRTNKPVAGSLSFGGAVAKATFRSLTASLAFAGTLSKRTIRALVAAISFIGALATSKIQHLALTGSLSFVGSLSRRTSRLLTGSLSFAGSLARTTARAFTAALSFTGAIAKQTLRALAGALSFVGSLATGAFHFVGLSGTLSFSGALAKTTIRGLTGSLSFSGALSRVSQRTLTGSLGFAGAISKRTSRALTASLSFVGSLAKQIGQAFTASLSFVGAITNRSVSRAFTASLSFTGAVSRRTSRALTGALSFSGSLAKQTQKALSGSLSFSGVIMKRTARLLAGSLGFTGTLAKTSSRAFTASLSFAGTISRQTRRALSASLSFVGDLTHGAFNVLDFTAALTFSGNLAKRTARDLSGTVSFVGDLAKTAGLALAASLSFAGEITKTTSRNLAGSLGFSGALSRSIARALAGAVAFVGATSKRTARAFTGVLDFVGDLVAATAGQFHRAFDADLSFIGSLATHKIPGPTTKHGGAGDLDRRRDRWKESEELVLLAAAIALA